MEALLQFLAEEDSFGESGCGTNGASLLLWGQHPAPPPPPPLKARLWLPARWDADAPSGISLPAEYPNRSLALSSLQTFKELGVSMARLCQPRPPPPQP